MEYSYIKKAEFRKPFQVFCEFEDGKQGILDLSRFKNRGGVFKKLEESSFAEQLQVSDGVLTWGNGELDLAPETVYHEITGSPLPDWMRQPVK